MRKRLGENERVWEEREREREKLEKWERVKERVNEKEIKRMKDWEKRGREGEREREKLKKQWERERERVIERMRNRESESVSEWERENEKETEREWKSERENDQERVKDCEREVLHLRVYNCSISNVYPAAHQVYPASAWNVLNVDIRPFFICFWFFLCFTHLPVVLLLCSNHSGRFTLRPELRLKLLPPDLWPGMNLPGQRPVNKRQTVGTSLKMTSRQGTTSL